MKNIHLLPTTKDQHSIIQKNTGLLLIQTPGKDYSGKKLNLYITSDEEIKDVRPYKGKWQLEQGEILNKFPTYLTDLSECKLVIMTTDQDLINDGVQAIDDEFLEWFVKNPTCEFVNVKKIRLTREITLEEYLAGKFPEVIEGAFSDRKPYKIIIPQTYPKQETIGKEFYESADKVIVVKRQETLEEAAEKWVFETNGHKWSNNDNTAGDNYGSFKEGAKWQSERMYSEEEVFNLCRRFAIFVAQTGASYEKQIQWFEQNKKK